MVEALRDYKTGECGDRVSCHKVYLKLLLPYVRSSQGCCSQDTGNNKVNINIHYRRWGCCSPPVLFLSITIEVKPNNTAKCGFNVHAAVIQAPFKYTAFYNGADVRADQMDISVRLQKAGL